MTKLWLWEKCQSKSHTWHWLMPFYLFLTTLTARWLKYLSLLLEKFSFVSFFMRKAIKATWRLMSLKLLPVDSASKGWLQVHSMYVITLEKEKKKLSCHFIYFIFIMCIWMVTNYKLLLLIANPWIIAFLSLKRILVISWLSSKTCSRPNRISWSIG